jgi:uncharacterized membrane protein YdfJ with MMPL/SSD domain
MVNITNFIRTKAFLVILAVLLLCVIIIFIALFLMYPDEAPKKAVYVFEILNEFLF